VLANAGADARLKAFNQIAILHFRGSKNRAAEALARLAEQECEKSPGGIPYPS
jgi:hypothetical protein